MTWLVGLIASGWKRAKTKLSDCFNHTLRVAFLPLSFSFLWQILLSPFSIMRSPEVNPAEYTEVSIPQNSCVSGSLQSFGDWGKYTNSSRTRQNKCAIQKLEIMYYKDPKQVFNACEIGWALLSHTHNHFPYISELDLQHFSTQKLRTTCTRITWSAG